MQVQVAIGENYCFKLREALLVYQDRQKSFVTRHEIADSPIGPPTLGPAQPLTSAFIEALVRSLHGACPAEVLPETILAKTDRMIAWWTPARRRQMFYQAADGRGATFDGLVFPQPPLIWRAEQGGLTIRALCENRRPAAATTLAMAPFWNLSEGGQVCTGTMRRPGSASVASIPEWERGFYESAFTHANVGRLTRHEGGFDGLWAGIAASRRRFPVETLIELPQTLAQFVRGESR